jgi:hypothetical protein
MALFEKSQLTRKSRIKSLPRSRINIYLASPQNKNLIFAVLNL